MEVINSVARGQSVTNEPSPATQPMIVKGPSWPSPFVISNTDVVRAVTERPRDSSTEIGNKFAAKLNLSLADRQITERMVGTAIAARLDVATRVNAVLALSSDADLRQEFAKLSRELSLHPRPRVFE